MLWLEKHWKSLAILLWVLVWSSVALWLGRYVSSFWSSTVSEEIICDSMCQLEKTWTEQEIIDQQSIEILCDVKQQKEKYLSSLWTFTWIKYFAWEYYDDQLEYFDYMLVWESERDLLSWVDCWVFYDKWNLEEMFSKEKKTFIQEVNAWENSKEDAKIEMKANSETWEKLQSKIETCEVNIKDWKWSQDELHKINQRIRAQFRDLGWDPLYAVNNSKLRDTKKTCKVNWKETSLWALVYGFVRQEVWYKKWSVWYKTNNWGSLRVDHKVVDIKGKRSADDTDNWLEYYTVEDWLYHLSYIISEKGYNCNIGRFSIFAYVYWPDGEQIAKRKAYINILWKNFQGYVSKYEQTFE